MWFWYGYGSRFVWSLPLLDANQSTESSHKVVQNMILGKPLKLHICHLFLQRKWNCFWHLLRRQPGHFARVARFACIVDFTQGCKGPWNIHLTWLHYISAQFFQEELPPLLPTYWHNVNAVLSQLASDRGSWHDARTHLRNLLSATYAYTTP